MVVEGKGAEADACVAEAALVDEHVALDEHGLAEQPPALAHVEQRAEVRRVRELVRAQAPLARARPHSRRQRRVVRQHVKQAERVLAHGTRHGGLRRGVAEGERVREAEGVERDGHGAVKVPFGPARRACGAHGVHGRRAVHLDAAPEVVKDRARSEQRRVTAEKLKVRRIVRLRQRERDAIRGIIRDAQAVAVCEGARCREEAWQVRPRASAAGGHALRLAFEHTQRRAPLRGTHMAAL